MARGRVSPGPQARGSTEFLAAVSAPLPSPDGLIALDHLCWLGSGRGVAERLSCNPSTVSRKAEACAVSLGLLLRKRSGLWTLYGNGDLLQAERDLHQRYRLAGYGPLRLEISGDLANPLAVPPHPAWTSGGQRHFTSGRPLELLEQRVIDAWLCSFCEELLGEEASSWQVRELARVPLLLFADSRHPLLSSADGVDPEAIDLRQWPCLALPDHCLPRRQAVLRRLGLANQIQSLERHDPAKWDEPLADGRTLRPGAAFELRQHPRWRSLAVSVPHEVRIGLVVCRDLQDHAAVRELHQALAEWFVEVLS